MAGVAQTDLTGVWDGMFSYPRAHPPTLFTAVVLDLGGRVSGTTHEVATIGAFAGQALEAAIDGARSGAALRFTKIYDAAAPGHRSPVSYEGVLSADATEIEGEWSIPGSWSGRFIMVRSEGAAEAAEERQRVSAPAL
ncbi:MAG TPA: hypothetical protein VHW60_20990 [Caulobacteraceae bacterium]|nr:hypothetical protein [Caulobacteraceae bacterium]